MSNILVRDIVGTGVFAVPTVNAQAYAATGAFNTLIGYDPGVAGLTYQERDIAAWVLDSREAGGGEGVRSLACHIPGITYMGTECPSEVQTDALIAAIVAVLVGASEGGTITSVGVTEITLFNAGAINPA